MTVPASLPTSGIALYSLPIAIAIAAVLDRTVAEPPVAVHPIALLGRVIGPIDDQYQSSFSVGILAAIVLPIGFAAVFGATTAVVGAVSPVGAPIVVGVLLFSLFSHRMLIDTAAEVVRLIDDDIDAARVELRALAGRDAETLSAGELRSAAIESAAENLADGLVAPLGAFAVVGFVVQWYAVGAVGAVGSIGTGPIAIGVLPLSAGIAAAAWMKAVNTLDSMLGYPEKRVGTASARLDDVVMWLPARIAAAFISLAVPSPDPLLAGRRWADRPPSPNSGWPMATIAAALHVKLEKPGAYVLNDLGQLPTHDEADRGVSLASRAGWLFIGACVLVTAIGTPSGAI